MSLAALPTALLLPPVNLMLGAGLGYLLLGNHPRLGRALLRVCLLGLLLLSLPATSKLLISSLETGLPTADPVAISKTGPAPAAIVILSGELNTARPEGGILPGIGVGPATRDRMHAGVVLARRTGLPILVTGGVVRPAEPPIAALMAIDIARDDGITVRWTEPRSIDTWENARFSADLLKKDGITTIYLVTHAWHMRRSMMAFAHFGITAIPAPIALDKWPDGSLDHFIPAVAAWYDSYYAFHEWVGCAAYAWRIWREA